MGRHRSTSFSNVETDDRVTFVPMDAVSDKYGTIKYREFRPASERAGYTSFKENDLIWAKITPCMENGKSAVATDLQHGLGFGSTEFHVFRPISSALDVRYLHAILRLRYVRDHAKLHFSGAAGQQRVE